MKKTLAVFFGGRSCEHDVSVITGLQAVHNADPALYDIVPVYIANDGAWYRGSALHDAAFFRAFDSSKVERCELVRGEEGAELVAWPPKKKGIFGKEEQGQRIDVALPCFHGMNGEDGTIQGLLELYGVPYTSAGMLGSSVGMDKIAQKALLRGCGVPVLPMCWLDRAQWQGDRVGVLARIEGELPYPLFVKPANLGSSIGITRAGDREGLAYALDVASEFDRRILVEQGLTNLSEVNCSALGFGDDVEASLCEMPVAWQEFLTFEDKYLRGGKGGKGASGKGGMADTVRRIPAPISEKMTALVRQTTIDVFKLLDLKGVVRVDFLIDNETGSLYVNEVNTIPGSLSFYLWEPKGLIFARLIDRMVQCALDAHRQKQSLKYTFDSNVLRGFSGSKS